MDAWQNSMVGTSEWETSFDDLCQDWFLQNTLPTSQLEPQNALFPTFIDTVHPEVSSLIPVEPLFQDRFFDIPEAMFQLESTFQPEPLEEGNRDPGKQPMSVSPTLSPNPINDVFYEASTSNTVESMNAIIDPEQEFEKHVKDSWAYISKLYSRKRKFIEPLNVLVVFGERIDLSEMPRPVCSCTGIPRTCGRWCGDGWISVCCTASVSMYPLPIRDGKGRIARLQGRRMGYGSFTRVVEELMLEGYDFDRPIDLKNHWVKIGSNRSRVIR